MNNFDDRDKRIKEKILKDAENLEIPDGLSTDNIMGEIKDTKQKKKRFYSTAWFKALGAAACVAVVVSLLFATGTLNLYTTTTYDSEYVGDEAKRQVGDYSDIYEVLKEYNYIDTVSTMNGLLSQKTGGASTAEIMVDDAAEYSDMDGMGGGDTYSDTNEQEEDVHEADVVKTDGEYIYSLTETYIESAKYDNEEAPQYKIVITEADGENTAVAAVIEEKSSEKYLYVRDMYVNGDRLVLLADKKIYADYDNDGEENFDVYYGYTTWTSDTVIIIYDISDRTSPEMITEISQSGDYNSSRMVGDILYTISNYSLYDFSAEDCVPYVADEYVSAADVYIPSEIDEASYVVISAIDINNPDEVIDTENVIMGYCDIYVSQNNIYLLDTFYEENADDDGVFTHINYSNIVKISYSDGKLAAAAENKVEGYIYDSYAVDEYDGYLRIATTSYEYSYYIEDGYGNRLSREEYWEEVDDETMSYTWTWLDDSDTEGNNVFVLDNNLNIVGSITGIADNEEIYSVRFIDRYGYFVTYENTDPLFAVDFANPTNPTILSELKVSGFSNYLHIWSDNYLLGLGEETDDDSISEGVKLSMFDKSDLLNITECAKIVFHNAIYSPAQYNHKALLVSSEKNLIGFCLEREFYNGENEYGETYYIDNNEYYYADAYMIVSYSETDGFKVMLSVASESDNYDFDYNTRGLYIGDYLYIVTPGGGIRVFDLNTFENVVDIEF